MRLQTLVVAVLIASLAMTVLGGAYSNTVSTYNIDAPATVGMNSSLIEEKVDDVDEVTTAIKDDLQDKENSFNLADTFNAFVKAGFTTARLVWNVVPMASDIINVISLQLGIPVIFTRVATTLVVALVAFTFVSAIFKWRL